MMDETQIAQIVKSQLKDAEVRVEDMTGTRDHFEIEVVSGAFDGLVLVERHRKMHQILEGPMQGAIHAVKFKTMTPGEKEARNKS